MVKKYGVVDRNLNRKSRLSLQERYEGETDYRDSGVASKILKSGSDTVRFDSMPTFALDGRRIEYKLKEVNVPNGYTQIESLE
ncbi:hypothetical protein MX850_00970 [Erysipelothrix sp. Poltava]|nr:hypothetical protein MX850_00970 [Erysipelothrix sp. Poltava]